MNLANPVFTLMAVVISILGAWTAIDLFRRVYANVGRARAAWLTAASAALGLAIWAMHQVHLLGQYSGASGSFDGPVMLTAVTVAISGCGFAFWLMSRRSRDLLFSLIGGGVVGATMAVADFVGMEGLIGLKVEGYHNPWLVAALVGAIIPSAIGMAISELSGAPVRRAVASILLALGMLLCHRASVAAFDLQPAVGVSGGIDPFFLAIAVSGGLVFVLFLASVAALFDRRFEGMAAIEAERNAAQLRSILEQTPVGIVVADAPSGDIRFFNSEAEYLMGHPLTDEPATPGELLPYGPVDDQGRRRNSENQPLMRAVRRGYRTDRMVQRYRKPDGSIVIFEVAAAPIRDADGRIVQAVATFHDITAKMKAE